MQDWRVLYGRNFWATRGRGKPGEEISLGHRFRWGDADWRGLNVYACSQGLALALAQHVPVSFTHFPAHETAPELRCRLLL